MSQPRILCSEPENYSRAGLARAAALGQFNSESLSQINFAERLPGYDAVMVRLQHRLTPEMLQSTTRLKAIITPTTGRDHIALDVAHERGVEVFSLFGATDFLPTIHSSAEHSFALLMSLIRRIPFAYNAVLGQEWQQVPFRGRELHSLTIGIVGYGRIGTKMARFAQAFGMNILTYDPYVRQYPDFVQPVGNLADMLPRCDILSIHVPFNKETEGMFNAGNLSLLPKGAYLVNTARGAVLDELALMHLLDKGHLAGAALDVLTHEFAIEQHGHPLINYAREHDNLLITPHIGGAAEEAIEKTDLYVLAQFQAWWHKQSL